jgi:hypothetical protein
VIQAALKPTDPVFRIDQLAVEKPRYPTNRVGCLRGFDRGQWGGEQGDQGKKANTEVGQPHELDFHDLRAAAGKSLIYFKNSSNHFVGTFEQLEPLAVP